MDLAIENGVALSQKGAGAEQVDGRDVGPARAGSRWNFSMFMLQGTAVDLSRVFASPQLVLPYLYMALGAPTLFAGVLIPIVQLARMVAQIVSAPRIASALVRKWYIVKGLLTIGVALLVVAVVARSLASLNLAFLFLAVAAGIGVGQGINRLAYQALVSRLMIRDQQNSLMLAQQGIAGLLAIVVAASAYLWIDASDPVGGQISLVWAGVIACVLSAAFTLAIRELTKDARTTPAPSSTPDGGRSIVRQMWRDMVLVRNIAWFRRYSIMRCLLLSVELAMPFYAIHAAEHHAGEAGTLNAFVIASSLGMMASGIFWQRQARRPLRYGLALAAGITFLAGVVAIFHDSLPHFHLQLAHSAIFFFVGLASEGASVARKVYLLTLAPRADTAQYVAISDAFTGVVAVAFGFALGSLAHITHAIWPIAVLMAINIATVAYALTLPKEI